MRCKKLNARTHRKVADQEFKDICKADGVSNLRASIYYKALRKFGKPAANPENKKKNFARPGKNNLNVFLFHKTGKWEHHPYLFDR